MATTDLKTEGDKPYYKDTEFFEGKLTAHSAIAHWERSGSSGQLYSITRERGDNFLLHLSDLYTLGEADYHHLTSSIPGLKCIVSISGYNRYTPEAKERAVKEKVGLFKFGEFFGAMNVQNFWEYVKPAPKGSASGKRRAD